MSRPAAAPLDRRSQVEVVAALLVPPLLWLGHQQVSYVIVGLVCQGGQGEDLLGIGLVEWGVTIVTVLALAAMAASALLAWRLWPARGAPSSTQQLMSFAGLAGLVLAGLFTLTIVFTAAPVYVLDHCG